MQNNLHKAHSTRYPVDISTLFLYNEWKHIPENKKDDPMRKAVHYIIILICVILIFFLYNKALGSIPFMILALYLFYFGWMQLDPRKKKTR